MFRNDSCGHWSRTNYGPMVLLGPEPVSCTIYVGTGALTRPAGQSPARFFADGNKEPWRALLARPDEGVRAYVAQAWGTMQRDLWKLLLGLVLLGCGGLPDGRPVGFVNQTRHSDAELWVIWKAAQETVAQQVDLNPLQRSFSGAAADIRPGDPRALRVMPHQLRVGAKPDVASSTLLAATGLDRGDPTGMIACPQPCNVRYAAAYSVYSRDLTQYAASWEEQGESFKFVLEYEFENQILAALGYSLKWR